MIMIYIWANLYESHMLNNIYVVLFIKGRIVLSV
jgi:hypothetical protein